MLARLLSLGAVLSLSSIALATSGEVEAVGVTNRWHDTKRGSEFWFDLPTELASRLEPGDLLEPDDETQSVVYYGGGIGFCVSPGTPAGNAATVYTFRGSRDEGALGAARNAEERGERRDEAVWDLVRRRRGEEPAGATEPMLPPAHSRAN